MEVSAITTTIDDNSKVARMAPTPSYAQSLRVIGQALDALEINSFRLEKRGTEYIVRADHTEGAGKLSWDESFVSAIAQRLWGRVDREQKNQNNGNADAAARWVI
jgi:hypothetical protein